MMLTRVVLAGAMVLNAGYALAIECPVGKAGPNPVPPAKQLVKEVTRHTYHEIDLGKEPIGAEGWNFRAWQIVFTPGATAPIHSHAKTPEYVIMKHGAITIYESNCTVPIIMKEGDVHFSVNPDQHWARNEGDIPAVMLVIDIYQKSDDVFPVLSQK